MVVALPGVLLAAVTSLTLKEPVRGRYDSNVQAGSVTPSFTAVLRRLIGKRAFLHVAFGAALATFANYGISNFAVPFLLRGFTINIAQAATAFGLISGVSATIGTGLGGWLVDKFGVVDRRNYVFIPAIGVISSAPLYIAVFLQTNLLVMAVLTIAPATIHYLYLGPTFGLTANMVDTRMRATASAIVLLIMNLVGLGLGPLVVGILSDRFASQIFTGGSFLTSCPGGRAAGDATAATAAACRNASFIGLKCALLIAALFYVWSGVHFLLASRTLARDTSLSNE
jgi:MFS family permease